MSEWTPIRRRLSGFMPRVSADIHALAQKMRQQLLTREDMPKLRGIDWNPNEDADPRLSVFAALSGLLHQLPDEGYKLFPWVVREVKRGCSGDIDALNGIAHQNYRHSMDILNQAIRWFVWSYEHNKPLPDYMAKTFDFDQMQAWVYEMNARDVDLSDGIHWKDSTPVYTFEDGWHIDDVRSDDLAQEGELMGHCVGGYCHTVQGGHSTIFSLRDPKGQPHVTVEFGGDVHDDVTKGYGQVEHHDLDLNIIQEQGKSDTKPIPEYQRRLDEWYDHLRENGWEVNYIDNDSGLENAEDVEYWDDTDTYPTTHQGIGQFYEDLKRDPWRFEYDEDPQYDMIHRERGRNQWTRTERVQNFINHPTATRTNAAGETHPTRADVGHLIDPLRETLQYLWSRPYNDEEAEGYAQAYFTAVHHLVGYHWRGENEPDPAKQALETMLGVASQWVAQKRLQRPQPKPNQPTLFEPDDFFTQKSLPRSVQTFMHYLTAYAQAAEQPPSPEGAQYEAVGDRVRQKADPFAYGGKMAPIMPGEGGHPVTRFPDYFHALERHAPGYFQRDWLDSLTNPAGLTQAHLVARLGHIASSEYPHCPFDQNELDLHFHGGASCPACGSEFEIGRNGEINPSDSSVWAQAQGWPNTIPAGWGSLSTEA